MVNLIEGLTRREKLEMHRRFDPKLRGLPPLIAGAISTQWLARDGDPVAQQLVEEAGGSNNLLRRARGLPVSSFKKVEITSF